jgi:hypothetical protein
MRRGSVALMGLDVAGYSDCIPFNPDEPTSWKKIFPDQNVESLITNDLSGGKYIPVDTSSLVSNTTYTAFVYCTEDSTSALKGDYVKFKVTSSNLKEF